MQALIPQRRGARPRANPPEPTAWKPRRRAWEDWQDDLIRRNFGRLSLDVLLAHTQSDDPGVVFNRAFKLLPLSDYLQRAKAYGDIRSRMGRRA